MERPTPWHPRADGLQDHIGPRLPQPLEQDFKVARFPMIVGVHKGHEGLLRRFQPGFARKENAPILGQDEHRSFARQFAFGELSCELGRPVSRGVVHKNDFHFPTVRRKGSREARHQTREVTGRSVKGDDDGNQ